MEKLSELIESSRFVPNRTRMSGEFGKVRNEQIGRKASNIRKAKLLGIV